MHALLFCVSSTHDPSFDPTRQKTIAIKEKELTWHTSNFVSISTQAALVSGFALNVFLTELDSYQEGENNAVVRFFFYFFTASSMALSILAVFNATLSNM